MELLLSSRQLHFNVVPSVDIIDGLAIESWQYKHYNWRERNVVSIR